MKTAGRIAIRTVAAVVAIAGGLLLFLATGPGEDFLRGLAERRIGAALGATVSIDSLETDIFSRLEVSGVAIDPSSDTSAIPSIRVERLRARYGLFTILFDGPEVDSVVVSGVRVTIRPAPSPRPAPPSASSARAFFDEGGRLVPPVRVGHLDLSDAAVVYDDREVPITLSGSGISINAGMAEDRSGVFRIGVDSTRVEFLDSPLGVTDLVLLGSINSRAAGGGVVPATLDSVRAVVAGMRVDGRVDLRADSVSGALTISGDPEAVLAAISDGLGDASGGPLEAAVAFTIEDPLDSAAFRWSIGVPSYTVAGVPVTRFRCDGGLRDDTLAIGNLSFGVYGGTVEGAGWMAVDSTLSHRFGLTASGVRVSEYWKPRTEPGPLTRIPVTVDGRIDTRGDLSTPDGIGASSTISVSTRGSLIAAPSVSYERRHLAVRSDRGVARLAADIDLRGRGQAVTGFDGSVDLSVPSFGALAPMIDLRGLGGSLEARGRVSGDGSAVRAEATATSDGISYRGLEVVDDLSASLRLEEDGLVIDSAVAAGRSVDLRELAGVLVGGGRGADGDGEDTIGVGGVLDYTLSVRGPVGNPAAELVAEIGGPAFGSMRFDTAYAVIGLSDSVVRVARAAIRKDSALTSVAGTADLRAMAGGGGADGGLVVEFRNAASRGGGFSPGSSAPDSITVRFAYADSANFSVAASSRHLSVATLREFVPELRVDGGQLDFDFDVRGSGDTLSAEIPFSVSGLTLRDGRIDSIAGTVRYADGTVALDSIRMSNEGRRLFASAVLELGRTPAGARAFDWEGRTRGVITGDTIHLSRIVPFLDEPVHLAGSLTADVRWDGIARRPRLRGALDLMGVEFGPEPGTRWITGLSGTVRLGGGAARSDSLTAMVGKLPVVIGLGLERGDSTDFSASLDVSTDSTLLLSTRASFTGDSIDVVAESRNLRLSALQPFTEALRKLDGRLTTRLTVRGPTSDPKVDGVLDIRGLSFEPGSTGFPVTDGAVSARLTSGRIALDSAAAGFGGGRLFASGGALIDSGRLGDLDLKILASDIRLQKKRLYQVNVKSVDLALRSAGERLPLTGVVEFGESKFVRDIDLTDIAQIMAAETGDPLEEKKRAEPLDLMAPVTKSPSVQEALPGFAKRIEFDVELRNAAGFWVDNNLAKFSSNHDLRLQGTLAEANVTGRITVRDRGELIFLDRKFEILNGVIDCSDPRRLNPVINLTAQTEITETPGGSQRPTRYTITLTVTGPLDEFEYALTSKPALEQADIISLIALGMTQYSLEAGGDKDAVYRDRSEIVASQQISNSVNRFFDNWLGDFLALDHIGIGGNLFDPNQTRFEVTKRWSDRVEIRYSTSIKNVDEQVLSAEYRITDFLYLEGKTDQKEDSGADLKFRVWFK